MDKRSADTKAAHTGAHAHPHTSGVAETGGASRLDAADDFLSSVRTLKEAEKSAAAKVEEGRRQAAKIEALGKEKAVEIASRANEKAVQTKNEILASGRGKTEQEVSGLHHEAKKQAEKIRAKRLNDRDVQGLSEQIV